jgi:hypothetical protein
MKSTNANVEKYKQQFAQMRKDFENKPNPITGAPAAGTQTPPPAAPAAGTQTPPPAAGTPTRRDQRRERQDMRRSNRRQMQDLRAQQRGNQ